MSLLQVDGVNSHMASVKGFGFSLHQGLSMPLTSLPLQQNLETPSILKSTIQAHRYLAEPSKPT